MSFYKKLEEVQAKIEEVGDLAAFCYEYIIESVGNETTFLGKYIWENSQASSSNSNNPNLGQLKIFSARVERHLRRIEKEGIGFLDCFQKIKELIKKQDQCMKLYGESGENESTIPYFVLAAVDRYMMVRKRCTGGMPLNSLYSERTLIYLKAKHHIMEKALYALDFPDIVESITVKNQFENIVFISKKQLPEGVENPRMISLYVDEADGERNRIAKGKEWKIVVVPFGRHRMVKCQMQDGALFNIGYEQEHLQNGINRALTLLDRAIDTGANVIVFPEFICYPQMQQEIGKHLKELYEKDYSRTRALFFVVAGSGWYEENNNIALIYSYTGRLLGKQYKYSQFAHGERGLVENLTSPGKETTIISIEGIGEFVVGICRDISNQDYTKHLVERFRANFLLVPAWSRSVNIAFKGQLQSLTANNHVTSSVVCNCCEALQAEKERVGIVVTPCKEGTVVEGRVEEIHRQGDYCKGCECGCIFLVGMVFKNKAVKEGAIVKVISQK